MDGQSSRKRLVATRLFRIAVWIVLGAITFYYFAHQARLMAIRVWNPGENSMIEPQPIEGALRVERGETLYRDYRKGRAVIPLTYGVLEYALPGWIARANGWESATAVARVGRSISLLSGIAVLFLAAALAGRMGAPSPWHWLAAVPLFWFPYPLEWFAKFAPDVPALACSIAGWWIIGRPDAWANRRLSPALLVRGAGALILWTIGFHFKPTVLAGQIGFAVEFLAFARLRESRDTRHWRRVVSVVALMGLACIVCDVLSALTINQATGGLYRLNLIDSMRVCRYDASFIPGVLGHLRSEGRWLFIWICFVAVFLVTVTPLGVAFFLVCILNLGFMMKQGSNVNYLLGSLLVWGMAATVSFGAWLRNAPPSGSNEEKTEESGEIEKLPRATRSLPRLAPWLLVPVAVFLCTNPWKSRVVYWELFPPTATELQKTDALLPKIPVSKILCLDAFYGESRGLPIPFADPYHAALLASHGVVSFAPEAKALRKREYRLVIGNRKLLEDMTYQGQKVLPESIAAALHSGYDVAYEGRWIVLWAPRKNGNGGEDATRRSGSENRPPSFRKKPSAPRNR